MKSLRIVFLLAAMGCFRSPEAVFAQGGGASSTGTISGRATDPSGGALPGVTVTLTSPSLMGTQEALTNEQGLYRFPAVPPGKYGITFKLAGFSSLLREGIVVAIGFTATVNAVLQLAAVEESVTVSGDAPLIDRTATRVQQNFKLEQLESLPSGRDMYSLLAVTPAVAMARIDVGGNRAGSQTAYVAYGFGTQGAQTRNSVEGVDVTNASASTGLFMDYSSFEEVFVGTVGQGAEMSAPGVNTQFLGKSGGNTFHGEIYQDWYNNSLQGENIPAEYLAPTAFGGNPLVPHGNEAVAYADFNIDGGGPIKRDRVWWFASYRRQSQAVRLVNLQFDETFDTRLFNPSGKVTVQANTRHKFIGYYQWGQKLQPYRTWNSTYVFRSPDDTEKQDNGTWIGKGEWNGSLTNSLYVEARYGWYGFYFPLVGYSDAPFRQDQGTRISEGGDQKNQQDLARKQVTAAATYFKDRWLGATHTIKVGGDVNLETSFNGSERTRAGNVEQIFNNGAAFRVILGFPTASGPVGSKGAHDDLLSISKTDQESLFVTDQVVRGRVTLNLGFRFDRYKSHIPEQRQLAFTNGPIALPAVTFQAQTFAVWNTVAPRAGLAYDVRGDGKTVIKANYGYFNHAPAGLSGFANPNARQKDITYTWTDRNRDGLYQLGEEGAVVSSRLAGSVSVNPDINSPYTHEALVYVERQISSDFAVRAGYVYKTTDNLWQAIQPGRPPSAYTAPFPFVDIGADGVRGSADDRTLAYVAIPAAELASRSANVVLANAGGQGRYKTVETSLSKRTSNRWSAGVGFGYTWTTEGNDTVRENLVSFTQPGFRSYVNQTPNDTAIQSSTNWSVKAYGTYDAPWGIRLSPLYRMQSGQNYGRTNSVSAPAAVGLYSATILMEPLNSRRTDNLNIVDLRVGKVLSYKRTKLNLMLDLFNIANTHAADVISFATGLGFERPANILAPRTAKIGFRYEW